MGCHVLFRAGHRVVHQPHFRNAGVSVRVTYLRPPLYWWGVAVCRTCAGTSLFRLVLTFTFSISRRSLPDPGRLPRRARSLPRGHAVDRDGPGHPIAANPDPELEFHDDFSKLILFHGLLWVLFGPNSASMRSSRSIWPAPAGGVGRPITDPKRTEEACEHRLG